MADHTIRIVLTDKTGMAYIIPPGDIRDISMSRGKASEAVFTGPDGGGSLVAVLDNHRNEGDATGKYDWLNQVAFLHGTRLQVQSPDGSAIYWGGRLLRLSSRRRQSAPTNTAVLYAAGPLGFFSAEHYRVSIHDSLLDEDVFFGDGVTTKTGKLIEALFTRGSPAISTIYGTGLTADELSLPVGSVDVPRGQAARDGRFGTALRPVNPVAAARVIEGLELGLLTEDRRGRITFIDHASLLAVTSGVTPVLTLTGLNDRLIDLDERDPWANVYNILEIVSGGDPRRYEKAGTAGTLAQAAAVVFPAELDTADLVEPVLEPGEVREQFIASPLLGVCSFTLTGGASYSGAVAKNWLEQADWRVIASGGAFKYQLQLTQTWADRIEAGTTGVSALSVSFTPAALISFTLGAQKVGPISDPLSQVLLGNRRFTSTEPLVAGVNVEYLAVLLARIAQYLKAPYRVVSLTLGAPTAAELELDVGDVVRMNVGGFGAIPQNYIVLRLEFTQGQGDNGRLGLLLREAADAGTTLIPVPDPDPPPLAVAVPEGLMFHEGAISWTPISGISTYQWEVTLADGTAVTNGTGTVSAPPVAVSALLETGMSYRFRVRSLVGLFGSAWSAWFPFSGPALPTGQYQAGGYALDATRKDRFLDNVSAGDIVATSGVTIEALGIETLVTGQFNLGLHQLNMPSDFFQLYRISNGSGSVGVDFYDGDSVNGAPGADLIILRQAFNTLARAVAIAAEWEALGFIQPYHIANNPTPAVDLDVIGMNIESGGLGWSGDYGIRPFAYKSSTSVGTGGTWLNYLLSSSIRRHHLYFWLPAEADQGLNQLITHLGSFVEIGHLELV